MPGEPVPFPHGIVTFLFTDIEGSTKTARSLAYRDYRLKLLDPQLDLLRQLVEETHQGRLSGTPAGDSVMAAFANVNDALECAVAIQQKLPAIAHTDAEGKTYGLPVRLGVHTSEKQIEPDANGLYLQHEDVIYAARIMSIAKGGQIVVSEEAHKQCDDQHWKWQPWKNRRVKDWNTPETLFVLKWGGPKDLEEPGTQYLPTWFRERNAYIPREALENRILARFTEKLPSGSPCRLVTLHGFGGMGKTRLGVQCCVQAAGLFAGRVLSASMDAISDEALKDEILRRDFFTARIAEAFGLEPNSANYETLPRLLPLEEPTLLLLDNFETVEGDASADLLAVLLEQCPNLSLLVTGRVYVGLDDWEFAQEIEELTRPEARLLLIERVRQHKGEPAWNSATEDEPALEKLLTLTGCHPLAVEIAAAHVRYKTLPEIATLLAEEPLVARPPGQRGTGERHRSLERCLNWSWKLLTPDEQTALVEISLFADDCPASEYKDSFLIAAQIIVQLCQIIEA